MFIQTQPTPNPLSLMFYARKSVMEVGSIDFPNAHSAMNSPFAKVIFRIDGILVCPLVQFDFVAAGDICGHYGFLFLWSAVVFGREREGESMRWGGRRKGVAMGRERERLR
ncbi:hypothetical protein AHAS_Ahas09G0283600 [Arachis hypogaea]